MVIPVDGHGRHVRTRGELVLERQLVGEGEGRKGVLLDALHADQVLRMKLQRPVGGAQNVDAPIADEAAAEIVKAAPIERQIEAEILLAAAAPSSATATRGCGRRARRRSARTGCARRRTTTAAASARNREFLVIRIARSKRPR